MYIIERIINALGEMNYLEPNPNITPLPVRKIAPHVTFTTRPTKIVPKM